MYGANYEKVVIIKKKRRRSYSPKDNLNIFEQKANCDKIENNSTTGDDEKWFRDASILNSFSAIALEELKTKNISVGLSQDMLMKLDQQNMNQFNGVDHKNPALSSGFHVSSTAVPSSSNSLKPRNKNKQPKLMPSKKYLSEMQPISVLINLTKQSDNDDRYIKCQVTLSRDIWEPKENSNSNDNLKSSKELDIWIDFSAFKDLNDKTNTPSREKRTYSIESLDMKADTKTKDTPISKDLSSSKDWLDLKTKWGSTIDSSARKSLEVNQFELSSKEENDEGPNLQTIMHSIFEDSIHLFKQTQTTKIVSISITSSKLAEFLESNSSQIKGWRIWEQTYSCCALDHLNSKTHKKNRDEIGMSDQEDILLSPIILSSIPGSIDDELFKLKESSMKLKYRKLKQQMINKGVSHDIAASAGKDITTASNKKKMQILSVELESKVMPAISDYSQLENKLNSLITILSSNKRQEELHLLRRLKIIPWVTEICKKISVWPRNEIKDLVRSIELAMQILFIFVSMRENKDYLLSTSKILLLTDLLIWTLNKPMHLFFGSTYVPQLLEVITICIKHRVSYENQQMKALMLEWILWSPIISKLKLKFESIEGPLQLTGKLCLIPTIICKGISLYEAITSIVNVDFRYRCVFEKSNKISPNMYFIIHKTKMFGVIPLIMDVLFEKAQHPKEMLPKYILNLTYISLKLINNMFRIDLKLWQEILSDTILQDQFYYVLNFIVKYCHFFEDQEEVQDILYESILMIGYYTLFNEKAQEKIRAGENSLLLKLCQLDISFFMEKQKKEILFPTLISLSFKDKINLDIIDNEMDKDYLKKYVRNAMKDELYNIPEDDLEKSLDSSSICSLGKKSHSISSTNSSTSITTNLRMEHCPFIQFSHRFPKNLLDDALEFYSQ